MNPGHLGNEIDFKFNKSAHNATTIFNRLGLTLVGHFTHWNLILTTFYDWIN